MTEVASTPPPTAEELMAASQALHGIKKELRSFMREKLASIPKSTLETQSNLVFQALFNLDSYKNARRISVYLSMPSGEVRTDVIVRHALSNGKEVFVPYLYKNGEASSAGPKKLMDMVRLKDIQDYESLERDSWGIPTITEQGIEERQWILGDGIGIKPSQGLDLMLMPGVAFDGCRTIRRLGHGKGFYDYFLHRYQSPINADHHNVSRKCPLLLGLALKEQFLQGGLQVPVGPLDKRLHGLIVGDGQTIGAASQ